MVIGLQNSQIMIKNHKIHNNKAKLMALIGTTAVITLLVTSLAAIGAAPFSYQQQTSDRQGPRITSANIVDGEVRNQDLATDAVTSDKIKNGEVKAEDLDPNIEMGGGNMPSFVPQVTERSNTVTIDGNCPPTCTSDDQLRTITIQCNSDEVVTGGGFDFDPRGGGGTGIFPAVFSSHKDGNGWTALIYTGDWSIDITVYAECLKVVQ